MVVAAVSAALAAAGALTATAQSGSSPSGDDQASGYPGKHPVVATDHGEVRGQADALVTSYKGIPYAKPPTGGLRWKAPQPAAKWNGVRDATAFGGSCTQGSGWDPGYDKPTLNEDCLYLNVYRPSRSTKKNLPVFVWNHGGGNTGGAGRDTNPDKFVTRQDVVYVTINYRLGSMGWLYSDALAKDNKDGAVNASVSSTSRRRCAGCSTTSAPSAGTRTTSRSSASPRAPATRAHNSPLPAPGACSTGRSCRAAAAPPPPGRRRRPRRAATTSRPRSTAPPPRPSWRACAARVRPRSWPPSRRSRRVRRCTARPCCPRTRWPC